jgi:hypothetical protein
MTRPFRQKSNFSLLSAEHEPPTPSSPWTLRGPTPNLGWNQREMLTSPEEIDFSQSKLSQDLFL